MKGQAEKPRNQEGGLKNEKQTRRQHSSDESEESDSDGDRKKRRRHDSGESSSESEKSDLKRTVVKVDEGKVNLSSLIQDFRWRHQLK